MKKSKKAQSFFSLLIKNYIAFTAVNVVLLIAIVIAGMVFTSFSLNMPIGEIAQQKSVLESGDFDMLKTESIVGSNGYIEILDAKNQVIFCSARVRKPQTTYTSGEVACIKELENPTFTVETSIVNNNNGGEQILVVRKSTSTAESNVFGWYEVLDNEFNIVSSSKSKFMRRSYTQSEFELLTGTSPDGYKRQKYAFTSDDGSAYMLIASTKQLDDSASLRLMGKSLRFFSALFLLTYIGCIALFVLWLNRKVKLPLEKLNKAFAAYASGRKEEPVQYNGPYEFVQLCDSFNRMADELNASEQEKKKMIADISHDLKTPITVIKGYAQAVASGVVPKEEEKEYLSTIYQKAEGLDELINIFYEYSKTQHPDYSLVREDADICEYAREYLAEKYKELSIFGFELEVAIPEAPLLCSFDKVQLKRVFENIIANSIRHNERGVTIFYALFPFDDKVKIIIADNGIGIPPEFAHAIFAPFVVGDESRTSNQGSGLGLTIGKRILEAHGGTIELLLPPEEPYKTEFQIILPKQ